MSRLPDAGTFLIAQTNQGEEAKLIAGWPTDLRMDAWHLARPE